MAVTTGLHNIPNFARPLSGKRDDDHCRRSTRASALLQIWREIEGEHLLSRSHRSRQHGYGSDSDSRSTTTSVGEGSENGDDFSQVSDEFENQGFNGSEIENEDNNSIISRKSSEFGEIERGRVRQVFREWTNICPQGRSPNGFNRKNCSGHRIGDMDRERVRIIRESKQIITLYGSSRASSRDVVAEIGSGNVQVHDNLVINHPEIGARRPLSRLCGRQTLIDLILKAQKERKRELLNLSERRPVSDFAHRNRIQAILRGSFLKNGRLVVDERPSSVAATELGFLRERHVVSDLRDEFLSKLDNSVSASVNSNGSSDTSYSGGNKGKPVSTSNEGGISRNHIAAGLEGTTADGNRHMQELDSQTVEAEESLLADDASQEDMPVCASSASSREGSTLAPEARQHQVSTHADLCGSRCEYINAANELLESPDLNCSGASIIHEVAIRTAVLEGNTSEELDSHDPSAQAEESQELVTETEHSGWQLLNTAALTEWADASRQDMDSSWNERASSQTIPLPSGNNVEEGDQMQESHDWPTHDLQEAIESWLDIPSIETGEQPVSEIDTFYFPYDDEDNVNSVELRELLSRRRVSSLLRSSFRESLDQVLQSQVERQARASVNWELESTSFHLEEQDHDQFNVDQSPTLSETADRNAFGQSSTLFDASQQQWINEDLQGVDWPHHFSNQQFEPEWDVFNELRIDLARLQERMNNMQGMLEACMEMQTELQWSLHQEVSAALSRSRSAGDADLSKDDHFHDETQWDHVKRGICCLCQRSKINSLLYRCGHMCTCTDCADNLVHSKGKCPMCCAPVVEAVCAYFLQ